MCTATKTTGALSELRSGDEGTAVAGAPALINAPAPYRDDHRPIQQFAQHIGVAEELLAQFESVPRRFANDISQDSLEQLKGEAHGAWEGVWEHLRHANEIVRAMGRSASGYAGARAMAGDIYVGAIDVRVGPWEHGYGGKRRTISWRNAPTQPAVDALRAAVPEVVVIRTVAPQVDLRSHGWLLDWWAGLVLLGIAGVVIWWCVG